MSKINNMNDYTNKYNTNADYSYLFGTVQNAAARISETYKSNGTYSNTLSEMVSNKVDSKL